jgi:ribonuclease P protein component
MSTTLAARGCGRVGSRAVRSPLGHRGPRRVGPVGAILANRVSSGPSGRGACLLLNLVCVRQPGRFGAVTRGGDHWSSIDASAVVADPTPNGWPPGQAIHRGSHPNCRGQVDGSRTPQAASGLAGPRARKSALRAGLRRWLKAAHQPDGTACQGASAPTHVTAAQGRPGAPEIGLTPCGRAAIDPPRHEAHLPAPQRSSQAHPWLSRAHGHQEWPQGPLRSPTPGPQAADRGHRQQITAVIPGAHRFGRAFRLRRRTDFLRVQGQGGKLHVRHFLVFVVRNPTTAELPPPRLGVTVTRKVGNAVTRNRIKRWVREAFRRQRAGLRAGLEMVWVAKRTAAEAVFAEVSADMERVCGRSDLRRGPQP